VCCSSITTDVGARKIYVGNLSFDTDKESLIEFYSQYGTVKDIYIPLDVGTGRGRGFAFVTMAEEDVDRAIQNTNGAEFMGRLLAVSIPLPRGTKVSPRPGKEENKSGTKLYVGNLSFYTTLDAIQELFGEYGQVMDCYLPQDRESGGSRGFAFVTLDHEGAMRAMEETDGYELDGRIIRVNEAEPRGLTSGRNNYYDDDEGGEEYSDNDASEY
jgi:RNA recognition motif-containing protein